MVQEVIASGTFTLGSDQRWFVVVVCFSVFILGPPLFIGSKANSKPNEVEEGISRMPFTIHEFSFGLIVGRRNIGIGQDGTNVADDTWYVIRSIIRSGSDNGG